MFPIIKPIEISHIFHIFKSHIIYIYMTENKIPKIEPIKLKEFDTKQSKYPMVPQIPFRSVILGPSSSRKTILLQTMILGVYI